MNMIIKIKKERINIVFEYEIEYNNEARKYALKAALEGCSKVDGDSTEGMYAVSRKGKGKVQEKDEWQKRIEFLEKNPCFAIVSDDNNHWACVSTGMQNCPDDEKPCDIETTFFIEKEEWKNSIAEAIDFAIEEERED